MGHDMTLTIPEGTTVPCVKEYALFNNRDLDPDVVDWINADPLTQGYVATKKYIAEQKAVHVCTRCPLVNECRQWAVETQQYGVLGGTTESERLGPNAIDNYNRTGESVTVYQYVEKRLAQKVPRRTIAEELNTTVGAVRHIHAMNLILSPDTQVAEEDIYYVTKKLFKAKIPQRLVADRLGDTVHYVRRIHSLGQARKHKTGFAVRVEKQYHKRWSRLTPTTVLVYNYLCAAQTAVDRETVLGDLTDVLPKQEKLKGVPKGRVFKTKKHQLRIGARRTITAALRAGVRSGVVEKNVVTTVGGMKQEYYRFRPEWVQRWNEYVTLHDDRHAPGQLALF